MSGFLSMYEQLLAGANGDEDEFYGNFEHLGYNRKLELDEAITYRLFVFTAKQGVMNQVCAESFDPEMREIVLLHATKQTVRVGGSHVNGTS